MTNPKPYKIGFILLCCILFVIAANAQIKEYKLVSRSDRSNFNYRAIKRINTYDEREKVFTPVKGKFTVYTFIATFKGILKRSNEESDCHDILIVKTNKNGKIIDAYQYTLEWAEMPLTYDLFRSSAKDVVIANGLSLDSLKLLRVETTEEDNKQHKDKGVVLLDKSAEWPVYDRYKQDRLRQ